ncbi:MAG: cation:proton antiporter, partial [Marinosulfonomonas sp.]|nr:cation:proton antiporter [Marinosulfonomonas sp.]
MDKNDTALPRLIRINAPCSATGHEDPMETETQFLTLGAMFFIGLSAHLIGHRTPVPRVTLLLLSGLVAGQMGWIPEEITGAYEFLSITALTLVAFLLGGSLKLSDLKVTGRRIFIISLAIVGLTLMVVSLGLIALGTDPALAIVLAGIATATAPAATTDVIRQSGISNDFTRTIEGIVAIDDAWGLLAFSLCISFAVSLTGTTESASLSVLHEIGGALVLGIAIGLPGAFLTGHIGGGEPLEVEALALVFLTAGLALWAEVSFLIAGMTAGAIIVNLASHHDRAFHEIEHIQWPFMVLFFVLAGALLDIHALRDVGFLGLAYLALRITARIAGGWLGAHLGGAPAPERRLFGLALLPQA